MRVNSGTRAHNDRYGVAGSVACKPTRAAVTVSAVPPRGARKCRRARRGGSRLGRGVVGLLLDRLREIFDEQRHRIQDRIDLDAERPLSRHWVLPDGRPAVPSTP